MFLDPSLRCMHCFDNWLITRRSPFRAPVAEQLKACVRRTRSSVLLYIKGQLKPIFLTVGSRRVENWFARRVGAFAWSGAGVGRSSSVGRRNRSALPMGSGHVRAIRQSTLVQPLGG